jgi:hypothetical protein
VYLINISNNGMMAEYRVRIWEFCVYVRILNLPFKLKLKGSRIGSGAFGIVLEKSIGTHKFVAKVKKMDINKEEIEDVVREVAISKLCSMLTIGPAV